MSEMIIEKGIPIAKMTRRGPKHKYPFYDMEIGDSILFRFNSKPSDKGAIRRERVKIQSSASRYGKKSDMKFVCRKEGHGVRVWRSV